MWKAKEVGSFGVFNLRLRRNTERDCLDEYTVRMEFMLAAYLASILSFKAFYTLHIFTLLYLHSFKSIGGK